MEEGGPNNGGPVTNAINKKRRSALGSSRSEKGQKGNEKSTTNTKMHQWGGRGLKKGCRLSGKEKQPRKIRKKKNVGGKRFDRGKNRSRVEI